MILFAAKHQRKILRGPRSSLDKTERIERRPEKRTKADTSKINYSYSAGPNPRKQKSARARKDLLLLPLIELLIDNMTEGTADD